MLLLCSGTTNFIVEKRYSCYEFIRLYAAITLLLLSAFENTSRGVYKVFISLCMVTNVFAPLAAQFPRHFWHITAVDIR
ncbi:hypothetical protein BJV82DRAFT_614724 [Fennellomyces sp. T-0311]|nr:hypothetical protein BJV82DRAFT_614724 [Fennellomyces sp. T-0311]